jgi:Caspase domain
MSQRLALLIGNSDYEDRKLAGLVTPSSDVAALADVLRNPEIGQFDDVIPLINQLEQKVRRAVAQLFTQRQTDDVLLFYFSGHGVKDDQGDLYFAVKDTDQALLSATAIPASFVKSQMDRSRSRRQILLLDCCYSGAFARGAKGGPGSSVGTADALEGTGSGRVVLTASDAAQYAWEGEHVRGNAQNSVFTRYLIEGLQSGKADTNGDGKITTDELYQYIYDRVLSESSNQTPEKCTFKQQGNFLVAYNPNPIIEPAELPPDVLQGIKDRHAWIRQGAVGQLNGLLSGADRGLRLAAELELKKLVDDDSRNVSRAASEVLQAYLAAQETAQVAKPEARASSKPSKPRPRPRKPEGEAIPPGLIEPSLKAERPREKERDQPAQHEPSPEPVRLSEVSNPAARIFEDLFRDSPRTPQPAPEPVVAPEHADSAPLVEPSRSASSGTTQTKAETQPGIAESPAEGRADDLSSPTITGTIKRFVTRPRLLCAAALVPAGWAVAMIIMPALLTYGFFYILPRSHTHGIVGLSIGALIAFLLFCLPWSRKLDKRGLIIPLLAGIITGVSTIGILESTYLPFHYETSPDFPQRFIGPVLRVGALVAGGLSGFAVGMALRLAVPAFRWKQVFITTAAWAVSGVIFVIGRFFNL